MYLMPRLSDSEKTCEFPVFRTVFLCDSNEINGFKGKDVVATLFVQGAEFLKCEYTIKNCLGITICFRDPTRAPRS